MLNNRLKLDYLISENVNDLTIICFSTHDKLTVSNLEVKHIYNLKKLFNHVEHKKNSTYQDVIPVIFGPKWGTMKSKTPTMSKNKETVVTADMPVYHMSLDG